MFLVDFLWAREMRSATPVKNPLAWNDCPPTNMCEDEDLPDEDVICTSGATITDPNERVAKVDVLKTTVETTPSGCYEHYRGRM